MGAGLKNGATHMGAGLKNEYALGWRWGGILGWRNQISATPGAFLFRQGCAAHRPRGAIEGDGAGGGGAEQQEGAEPRIGQEISEK